jgi:hypothetical protein
MTTIADPVALVDSQFAALGGRDLVAWGEIVDKLLDLHQLVDGDTKTNIQRHIAGLGARELVSTAEAMDVLLDIRRDLTR